MLDSSKPTLGTSATAKVSGKLGDFSSFVARGSWRAACTTQNTSPPWRQTKIAMLATMLAHVVWQSLSRGHSLLWSRIARVHLFHHNSLFVFSWQWASQVLPIWRSRCKIWCTLN